ncbi:M4 family metallopeptidase [Streptomyces sp. W1SF4]|uniref:M4 family metallopeptidase n=1 Tax=Streptomyces sp. W1SF4 TaxID=2305220 RepID=UPI000F6C6F54|nr:M4 family metallopeptidase [Streptomyces sp. W1SF4]AZM90294.1 M4 family peptidase [Streptomyces sp. W1SF4]
MSHPHRPRRLALTAAALLGAAALASTTPATAGTGAATGTGITQYSATVPLGTTSTGTTPTAYQLQDPTRGGQRTLDALNQTDNPGVPFTDADNTWGDGTPAHRQTAAADVHYATAMTWDFYKAAFNRNGVRGDGAGTTSRVHYGSGFGNAFWSDSCACVTYGDGTTPGRPPTSLDVVGHELAHGLTASTARLGYSGEPGALNEGTSDILATAGEFFAENKADPGDYLLGERVFDGPPRRMDRPSADGVSRDYWSSDIAALDPHAGSGPARHFYYLLAEGSGPKVIDGVAYDSPTHDGSKLLGIGRDKATRIWYRALTLHMRSTTNYAGARTATLRAAADLYGPSAPETARVAAAWTAVNVR